MMFVEDAEVNLPTHCLNNLNILASFLEEKHAKLIYFDMSDYGKLLPENNVCGTVACAAGHGPMAGIEPLKDEGWGSYIERCFTADNDYLWEYLFSSNWSITDNTPLGAAARIRYILACGSIPAVPRRDYMMETVDIDYDTNIYQSFLFKF